MRKIIVVLIGSGGSGKTSAARHLTDKYGFASFAFSDAIRQYAIDNDISLDKRVDYANTHAEMLRKYGWDYTLKLGLELDAELICIDDVRSPRFADVIREAGGVLIAFDCPTEIRFGHVRGNANKAKYPDNLPAFLLNEQADEATIIGEGLEFNTKSVMQSVDHHIDASGTLENTFVQLDEIIENLLLRIK